MKAVGEMNITNMPVIGTFMRAAETVGDVFEVVEDAATTFVVGALTTPFGCNMESCQGQPGPRGETGPQGDAGPRGETGPRGDAGPRGQTGLPSVNACGEDLHPSSASFINTVCGEDSLRLNLSPMTRCAPLSQFTMLAADAGAAMNQASSCAQNMRLNQAYASFFHLTTFLTTVNTDTAAFRIRTNCSTSLREAITDGDNALVNQNFDSEYDAIVALFDAAGKAVPADILNIPTDSEGTPSIHANILNDIEAIEEEQTNGSLRWMPRLVAVRAALEHLPEGDTRNAVLSMLHDALQPVRDALPNTRPSLDESRRNCCAEDPDFVISSLLCRLESALENDGEINICGQRPARRRSGGGRPRPPRPQPSSGGGGIPSAFEID